MNSYKESKQYLLTVAMQTIAIKLFNDKTLAPGEEKCFVSDTEDKQKIYLDSEKMFLNFKKKIVFTI